MESISKTDFLTTILLLLLSVLLLLELVGSIKSNKKSLYQNNRIVGLQDSLINITNEYSQYKDSINNTKIVKIPILLGVGTKEYPFHTDTIYFKKH